MNAMSDIFNALRVAVRAALREWQDRRWLRRGGCPDELPF